MSGTFAFLSTQFSAAPSIIESGNNNEVKEKLLKKDGLTNTFIGLDTII